MVDGHLCVVETATFKHELVALEAENKVYHQLVGSELVPRSLGYVFEEDEDRIIGFLMEELSGQHPNIADLEVAAWLLKIYMLWT